MDKPHLRQNIILVASCIVNIGAGKVAIMPLSYTAPSNGNIAVIESHPHRPVGIDVKHGVMGDGTMSLILENNSMNNIVINQGTSIATLRYIRQ